MRTRLLAAIALVAMVASCSDGGGADANGGQGITLHPSTDATSLGQPDHPIAGPQGKVPQFVVECGYSHAAADDPIVAPGEPGASHLHVFFGNTDVDAFTTVGSLLQGDTTCDQQLDLAAYWAPALLRGPEVLRPVKSTAYYRPGIDVDPTTVQPFPEGLVMVAGNSATSVEQPLSIVAWGCGVGIDRWALPPECPASRNLRLIITFPDCWDGLHLDSENHHTHVAYSSRGVCPTGYPVPVPQMQFSVEYPVTGSTAGLELSSGGLLTGHADFMNGWVQSKLADEVELCLHRKVVCGLASGRTSG